MWGLAPISRGARGWHKITVAGVLKITCSGSVKVPRISTGLFNEIAGEAGYGGGFPKF